MEALHRGQVGALPSNIRGLKEHVIIPVIIHKKVKILLEI